MNFLLTYLREFTTLCLLILPLRSISNSLHHYFFPSSSPLSLSLSCPHSLWGNLLFLLPSLCSTLHLTLPKSKKHQQQQKQRRQKKETRLELATFCVLCLSACGECVRRVCAARRNQQQQQQQRPSSSGCGFLSFNLLNDTVRKSQKFSRVATGTRRRRQRRLRLLRCLWHQLFATFTMCTKCVLWFIWDKPVEGEVAGGGGGNVCTTAATAAKKLQM